MYEFHPYFTNDGSVGLYNTEFDDIYHSACGALTEAYEKFVYPIDFEKLLKKDSIKILDICYGIGYNSKSFLNYLFFENQSRKFFSKNNITTITHIEAIDTNNIVHKRAKEFIKNITQLATYNWSIYTNNISNEEKPKIYIKAIDTDKNLSFLSPFIKTGQKNFKNDELNFKYNKIDKFLNTHKSNNRPKINKLVNYLILEKILQNNPEIFENKDVISILESKEFDKYFDPKIRGIFNSYKNRMTCSSSSSHKLAFLHNIYYKYITRCYKNALKAYNLEGFNFELKNDDARIIIQEDNQTYNLIFLDAFTPTKCPCLWTYDFFNVLYNHLEPDGIILTYSTSTAVKSAMIEANFYVGYIYNEREQRITGTIASKSRDMIKLPLSEYDLGLIKTSAGIFYRDESLAAQNEAIIEQRKFEQKNSSRISRSHYEKIYKEGKCSTI